MGPSTTGGRRGLVLIGKPGAGKGTQGRMLGAAPGLVHVATGAVLRDLAQSGTDIGQRVEAMLDQGRLIPDDLMLSVLDRHLQDLEDRGAYDREEDLLVLDGVPRTVGQVEALDGVVRVLRVVHLRCDDDDEVIRRMLARAGTEGRRDDRAATIRLRLEAWAKETVPVLEAYPPSLRTEVDGLQHPLVVHAALVEQVLELVLTRPPS